MTLITVLQVISSTTANKNCVTSIADSDILGFLFLTLHTLPSGGSSTVPLTLPTTGSVFASLLRLFHSNPRDFDYAVACLPSVLYFFDEVFWLSCLSFSFEHE